jgi:hypothetical protein
LCAVVYPNTEDLDPLSAFALAQLPIPEASADLELAVDSRVVPSLLHFYRESRHQPGLPAVALANLRLAAETYLDPESQYELAKVLGAENNLSGAMNLLREAFDWAFVKAGVEMGLMLSPASGHWPLASSQRPKRTPNWPLRSSRSVRIGRSLR